MKPSNTVTPQERVRLYKDLKEEARRRAQDFDSDDDGLGYDDSSSGDEGALARLYAQQVHVSGVYSEAGQSQTPEEQLLAVASRIFEEPGPDNQGDVGVTSALAASAVLASEMRQQDETAANRYWRKLLSGTKLEFMVEGLSINFYSAAEPIVLRGQHVPRFFFDVSSV